MQHGSIIRSAVLALLATLAIAPLAEAGDVRTVRAKKTRAGVATFKIPPSVGAVPIRTARLRVGKRTRRISVVRVRRAAGGPPARVRRARGSKVRVERRARKLRVRLNRRERRASRRSKPRLVIYRAKKRVPKKEQPQPAPEAAPAPADGDDSVAEAAPQHSEPVDERETAAPSQPSSPPAESPAPGQKSTFRPAFSAILTDAEAAARVRSAREIRPENAVANSTVATAAQLETFRRENSSIYEPHERLVTGAFRGTTDEIIQWAAWKWGIDEDVFRAQAAVETWWKPSFVGDNGKSFGLYQIKRTVHLGTYPTSVESTAFNADYTGALFRYYYDGHAKWLMDVEHGKTYVPGDAWGALGAHYSGRWYTSGSLEYMDKVKRTLADRVWEKPGF